MRPERPRAPARLALAAWLALPACAARAPATPPTASYRPTLAEYRAFRGDHLDLLEPNYLPFMTHPTPDGDAQVFCRWPDEAMPLAVHVVVPEIAESLQDEFAPREPQAYVRAVERALRTWEQELEGRVRFRLVERPGDARLVLRLVGEQAGSEGGREILGETPDAGKCRIEGGEPGSGGLRVAFEVREARLYLADDVGLLPPDLFEWVALHEIGHALGMRGHSPVPADLMYAVARDRTLDTESHRVGVPGLSPEDVNSFVSLYELPNGAVFARRAEGAGRALPARPGAPELAIGPYVDARLGFEFRPPRDWMRVPTAQGVAVVDGVTWEPSPSLQIVVHRYDTIEAFLARYGPWYRSRGRLSSPEELAVAGHRALRVSIDDREGLAWEEVTLIESGDGRILVATGECPPELAGEYRPWFRAAVASLEIVGSSR